MLPSDLPPPLPIASPAPQIVICTPFTVVDNAELQMSREQAAFNNAVKIFDEGLAKLPPQHKAAVDKIHNEVDTWVEKERSAGKKADKLATFVGKVMTYLHERLLDIEKHDPQLKRLKNEHRQLQKLFLQGDDVINAYLTWVKVKNDPIDRPKKT